LFWQGVAGAVVGGKAFDQLDHGEGPLPSGAERRGSLPTALTISVKETLDLLDGKFLGVSQGLVEGQYALWLGSGISRDRVIGLDGMLAKLIEFLRGNATADADGAYRKALEKVLSMAAPSAEEKAGIDLSQPAINWPCLPSLLTRLWKQYADVLESDSEFAAQVSPWRAVVRAA
jgi:hypothetical protein